MRNWKRRELVKSGKPVQDCGMEKAEHGKRLREAMTSRDIDNKALAEALEVNGKTVTNWRSGTTMPSSTDRANLRRILGAYDAEGDPVEVAVRGSELIDWRQDLVLSTYRRNLHEQRAEAVS